MSEFLFVATLVAMGFVPSLVWLLFYLRQDCHPEPKTLVIKTFLMGIVLAPCAVLIQYLLVGSGIEGKSHLFFLLAALVEEVVKFMAVKYAVLNDPEFNEPVDAMVYMIIASLGFATIENILYLFASISFSDISYTLEKTFSVWISRFIGSTVLHAMASGIIGYFLAISWFYKNHSKKIIFFGLFLGTALHFVFNAVLLHYQYNEAMAVKYTATGLFLIMILILILFSKLRNRRIIH